MDQEVPDCPFVLGTQLAPEVQFLRERRVALLDPEIHPLHPLQRLPISDRKKVLKKTNSNVSYLKTMMLSPIPAKENILVPVSCDFVND